MKYTFKAVNVMLSNATNQPRLTAVFILHTCSRSTITGCDTGATSVIYCDIFMLYILKCTSSLT